MQIFISNMRKISADCAIPTLLGACLRIGCEFTFGLKFDTANNTPNHMALLLLNIPLDYNHNDIG